MAQFAINVDNGTQGYADACTSTLGTRQQTSDLGILINSEHPKP